MTRNCHSLSQKKFASKTIKYQSGWKCVLVCFSLIILKMMSQCQNKSDILVVYQLVLPSLWVKYYMGLTLNLFFKRIQYNGRRKRKTIKFETLFTHVKCTCCNSVCFLENSFFFCSVCFRNFETLFIFYWKFVLA